MADTGLREKLRAYQSGALSLIDMVRAIQRCGLWPTYEYTPCTCNPETRCTRRGDLCPKCDGDGWVEQRVTGWVSPSAV